MLEHSASPLPELAARHAKAIRGAAIFASLLSARERRTLFAACRLAPEFTEALSNGSDASSTARELSFRQKGLRRARRAGATVRPSVRGLHRPPTRHSAAVSRRKNSSRRRAIIILQPNRPAC